MEDSGLVSIATADEPAAQWVLRRIRSICAEPEVGRVYAGVVTRIIDKTGAIVEILPGTDAWCTSANSRLPGQCGGRRVKEGDRFNVLLMEIDRAKGRLKLSRSARWTPTLKPSSTGWTNEDRRRRLIDDWFDHSDTLAVLLERF